VSLRSFSIGVGIISTTSELVDIIRNFKSNAFWFKKILYEENAPQDRFLMTKNAPQARPIKQNAPRPDFLTNSQWVLCPIYISCNLYLTNHRSESSSLNGVINELINELTHY